METSCSIRFIWPNTPKSLKFLCLPFVLYHPTSLSKKPSSWSLAIESSVVLSISSRLMHGSSPFPSPHKEAHLPVYTLLTVPGSPFRKSQWPLCDRLRICFSSVNIIHFYFSPDHFSSFPHCCIRVLILPDPAVCLNYTLPHWEVLLSRFLGSFISQQSSDWELGSIIFVNSKVPTTVPCVLAK